MEFLYETHMHTSEICACGVSTAVEQVQAYKKRGYTGIIITDHFINGNSHRTYAHTWKEKMEWFITGYLKAKEEGDKCGIDVFFGWEYSIRGSDFLTYGLGFDFLFNHPNIDQLEINEYSSLIRSCRGFLAQAHPFRNEPYIHYKFPVEPHLIDAIEVYNAARPQIDNEKAFAFAKEHDLPMMSGSDSHNVNLPHIGGIILEKKAETIFDIIDAIKSKKVGLISK